MCEWLNHELQRYNTDFFRVRVGDWRLGLGYNKHNKHKNIKSEVRMKYSTKQQNQKPFHLTKLYKQRIRNDFL